MFDLSSKWYRFADQSTDAIGELRRQTAHLSREDQARVIRQYQSTITVGARKEQPYRSSQFLRPDKSVRLDRLKQ